MDLGWWSTQTDGPAEGIGGILIVYICLCDERMEVSHET